MPEIIVAGHLCLDIVPGISTTSELQPGRLFEVGPAAISVGGATGNTGIALARLGADVGILAQIGNDAFGDLVDTLLRKVAEGLSDNLVKVEGAVTSYTVVINRPGIDRTFLHCPGVNETFRPSEIGEAALSGSKILHFGYPQLLRTVYESGGSELVELFKRARSLGILTSLDTTFPDPNSDSGRVDWLGFLRNVLPHTDLFCPSSDELAFMLKTDDPPEKMLEFCLDLGAGGVMVKLGADGLIAQWKGQRIRQHAYPVEVLGTTGCGDSAIAGFLFAIAKGWGLEKALKVAAASGAARCGILNAEQGPTTAELLTRFKID